MRRRLDSLIWKERARDAWPFALLLVVLAALFAFIYWPDPVVEVRTVRGTVTYWTRQQTEHGAGALIMRVSLADGRDITIREHSVDFPRHGPVEVEQRRHESGRMSFRWVKWLEPSGSVRSHESQALGL